MSSLVILGALVMVGAGLAPAPAARAGTAEAAVPAEAAMDAARKINLAGRQRMLTQRMAKAACFVALGVEVEAHREMMRTAHALFDRTLDGLRDGDADQGLAPEHNAKVLAGLDAVRRLWRHYGREIDRAGAADTVGPERLSRIAALNMPILAEMNQTVTLTERAYGNRAVPVHKAVALNISGRQRMLTQKMTKELCLVTMGHAPAETRAALGDTIALFEASLAALIEGAPDVGIRQPSSTALRDQLRLVLTMWSDIAPLYRAVADGGGLTEAEILLLSGENNRLLAEMNRAVFLFETD